MAKAIGMIEYMTVSLGVDATDTMLISKATSIVIFAPLQVLIIPSPTTANVLRNALQGQQAYASQPHAQSPIKLSHSLEMHYKY